MLRTYTALIVILLTATSFVSAQNEPISITSGFMTGNQYRGNSGNGKRGYATGVIDGMLFSPVFGASRAKLAWLERCLVGMTTDQVAAIVDRFLEAHPERWNQHMHGLVFDAMRAACPGAG